MELEQYDNMLIRRILFGNSDTVNGWRRNGKMSLRSTVFTFNERRPIGRKKYSISRVRVCKLFRGDFALCDGPMDGRTDEWAELSIESCERD